MTAMWRMTMVALSLIAVLSSAPLRQAAAADDYARSQDANGRHTLDTPDGEVGDDKDLSILKAGGETHSLTAVNLLGMSDVYFVASSRFLSVPTLGDRRWADLSGLIRACPGRRSVWLQCFLF
jgi:hypothetical protein